MGVVGSTAAPKVKHMPVFMQAADLADDFGHGDTRTAYASDKSVVHINEITEGLLISSIALK